jgi:hypothetical protein
MATLFILYFEGLQQMVLNSAVLLQHATVFFRKKGSTPDFIESPKQGEEYRSLVTAIIFTRVPAPNTIAHRRSDHP